MRFLASSMISSPRPRRLEIVKGAPEKVFVLCRFPGNAYVLNNRLADEGLRVLAVLYLQL